MHGLPAIGTTGFGIEYVIGLKRVPFPPAITTALILIKLDNIIIYIILYYRYRNAGLCSNMRIRIYCKAYITGINNINFLYNIVEHIIVNWL